MAPNSDRYHKTIWTESLKGIFIDKPAVKGACESLADWFEEEEGNVMANPLKHVKTICKEVSESHGHIYEIAEIIDNQMPLKYQDAWVNAMKKQGYHD